MASFVLTNLRILAFVKAFLFFFVQIIRVVSTIYFFICLSSKLKRISYCAFYGPLDAIFFICCWLIVPFVCSYWCGLRELPFYYYF